VKYYSVQDLGDTYRIFTKNTLWLGNARTGVTETIEIGNDTYTITAVECNQAIDVSSDSVPLPDLSGTYTIPASDRLKFYNGTLKRVNEELKKKNADTFQPLVYLVEILPGTQKLDKASAISETADVRMFVADHLKKADWLTSDEIYTEVLRRLEGMAEAILKAFKRSPLIGQLDIDSRSWNHFDLGDYNDNGAERQFFTTPMSAVEIRLTLPLRKGCYC